MALTVNNVVVVNNESVGDPRSYNAGTATNRILIVAVSISFADGNDITAVTYGGQSLTRAGTQDDPYNFTTAEVWYLLSPPSGANSLQVTSGDDTVVSIVICYVSADGAISVGNTAGAQGDSSTASASITPQASGSLLLATIVSNADGSMSATGGSTELGEANAPDTGLQSTGLYSKSTSGTGSHSIAATVPSDGWAVEVMEVKEVTAQSLTMPFISSAVTISVPTLFMVIAMPAISSVTALYAPELTAGGNSLSMPHLDSVTTLNAPVVLRGAVDITMPIIDSVTDSHEPSMIQIVSMPFIEAADELFEPEVTVGTYTLQMPHISSANTLNTPNVTVGGFTLSVPHIDSTTVLYGQAMQRAMNPTELLLLGVG